MKQNIFIAGLLFSSMVSLSAQTLGTFVGENALLYISQPALMYIGGGHTTKGGLVKNKGSIIIVGNVNQTFRTLNADGTPATQTEVDAGKNYFTNIINEPENFALANTTAQGDKFTYGQLFITGIPQANITGYVSEEYRNVNHGAYQQFGVSFYNKTIQSLGNNLGKSFSSVRWSQNEALKYNNSEVVSDYLNVNQLLNDPGGYYILGNKSGSLDVSTVTRIVAGIPFADGSSVIKTLQNAGSGVNYGTGGTAINKYNERYNSYLQDAFELQSAVGGAPWQGNYGKNLYQFSNPFLVNIDLRKIFLNSNVYGVRLEQQDKTVIYNTSTGGGANGTFRYVTWDPGSNSPVGDVDWLVIRPFGTFVIKLKNNSAPVSLDLNSLRQFEYTSGSQQIALPMLSEKVKTQGKQTSYEKKTVKQLAVIALDANQVEMGRTYYAVSSSAQTAHSDNTKYQIAASSSNPIGTFEETKEGVYDKDMATKYWLYINEANETDYLGKLITLASYNTNVKSLKFEIRENAEVVSANSKLSSGIDFYYVMDGKKVALKSGDKIWVPDQKFTIGLSYGNPLQTLATSDIKENVSRTKVVFSEAEEKNVILFDPTWMKADLQIYNMSGTLISSEKSVDTTTNHIITLPNVKGIYILKAISDNGEVFTSKILNK